MYWSLPSFLAMALTRLFEETKNKNFKILIHFEMQDPWKSNTSSFVEDKKPQPLFSYAA